MQTRLVAGVLVLLVALAGCTGTFQTNESESAPADASTLNRNAATGPNVTTIDVTGTGQASADPDLALVFVSVTARADTAEQARSQTAADVNRMRSALRTANVPDESVTTTSFRIFPRYDTTDGDAELVGYTAVHAFRVETAPDRAGEAIDLATGNGADQVEGVQFTVTDETRASLRDQALENAVTAARSDADIVASSTDLSVAGVKHISTSGGFTPVTDVRLDEAARGGETRLEPGPVTVEASVSVTYIAD